MRTSRAPGSGISFSTRTRSAPGVCDLDGFHQRHGAVVLSAGSVVATDSHDSSRSCRYKRRESLRGETVMEMERCPACGWPAPKGRPCPRGCGAIVPSASAPAQFQPPRAAQTGPAYARTNEPVYPSVDVPAPAAPTATTRHHRPRAPLLPRPPPLQAATAPEARTPGLPPPCRARGHRGLSPSADHRAHPDHRLERMEHLPRSPAVPPVGGLDRPHRLRGRTSTTGCGSRSPCSKSSPPSSW